MAYYGAYPNWLTKEYPGMEGINTALTGFKTLLNDPGYKQLTGAQASDPAAQEYQAASTSGSGSASAPGLFGRMLAGQMGANVAGQAAQDQGQQAAQKGRVDANSAAANIMTGRQESDIALQNAEAKQAIGQLGAFSGILNTATDPKGLGANVMGIGKGTNTTSPTSGLFSKLSEWLGKIPGIPGFPTPAQTILPPGPLSNPSSPWDILGTGGTGGQLDPETLALLFGA